MLFRGPLFTSPIGVTCSSLPALTVATIDTRYSSSATASTPVSRFIGVNSLWAMDIKQCSDLQPSMLTSEHRSVKRKLNEVVELVGDLERGAAIQETVTGAVLGAL
ncbi:hypothetical protein R1sor_021966 [Riccia sorocarpa]|uniref:Uncharacterized protein n=1 Tax=Riccia sorocarpa TaxID=122646 RepID=A0ABD3GLN5_9MARC